MTGEVPREHVPSSQFTNGAGVAALLSAGLGVFTIAVLAIIADHSSSFKKLMTFYAPTGPLSGVTSTAVAVWLISWLALDAIWKRREVRASWIVTALGLILLSFLLFVPPISDLF